MCVCVVKLWFCNSLVHVIVTIGASIAGATVVDMDTSPGSLVLVLVVVLVVVGQQLW